MDVVSGINLKEEPQSSSEYHCLQDNELSDQRSEMYFRIVCTLLAEILYAMHIRHKNKRTKKEVLKLDVLIGTSTRDI